MTEKIFSKIFPNSNIETLLTNEKFDFEVKQVNIPELNLKLIATDGLSRREMPVDEENKIFRKVEIMFCLPDYFSLETVEWPVYWINRIGEIPKKFNTWFGPGDTIPAGNPPKELSVDFKANHFILSKSLELKGKLDSTDANCEFLSIIPVFQAELDFKLRNSGTALLMRLDKKGFTDKVDTFRTSVCRKRILGF